MGISKKRVLTNYVRECIKTGQQIKTRSGKYGFVPQEGEDKLFEQCYKEGDPIRKQFDENLFLSEKYCHLVEVYNNGNVYFIMPEAHQRNKNRESEGLRWRYFKAKEKNGKVICPSGLSVYTVYGLVFECEIIGSDARRLLENDIYTAFGRSDYELQTHHKIEKYKEPVLDDNGVPVFDEDVNKLEIISRAIHDLKIPKVDTSEEEAEKFDKQLENLLPDDDKNKPRVTSFPVNGEKNASGSIHILDNKEDAERELKENESLKDKCPELENFIPDPDKPKKE